MKYRFNDFQLDSTQFTLFQTDKDGERQVPLEPKVFDLVVYLIENRSRLVTRDELFEKVWDGRAVVDTSLSNHIKTARKALGDRADLQATIKTVRGRGYQFVAPVYLEEREFEQPRHGSQQEVLSSHRSSAIITAISIGVFLLAALLGYKFFPSKTPTPTLLVLPFSTSADTVKGWQPFAEQLSREVILRLRHIADIRVIPESSAFTFQHNDQSDDIHHRLPDVTHVLSARINVRGDEQVQIKAELESVPAGKLIWDDKFLTKVNDENFFAVQSSIAMSVTDTLKIYLSKADKKALQRLPTSNLTAYETYIQGRQHLSKLTHESVLTAIDLFNHAIDLDRDFADAYVARANALRILMTYFEKPSETLPKVIVAVDQVLTKAPDSAQAMSSLGLAYAFSWRWNDAWQMLHAARRADDKLALTELGFALYYSGVGAPEKVKLALQRAKQLDPLNIEVADWGHWALAMVGDTKSAIDWSNTMLQLHPDVGLLYSGASVSYSLTGDHKKAISLAQKGVALESGSAYSLLALAQAHAYAGNQKQARQLLKRAQFSPSYQCPYETAVVHIVLGENDRAFELFNEAIAYRSNCLVFTRQDARLSPIRHDPRYQALLTRIGLDDVALANLPK